MENKKSIRGVQITDAIRKELEDAGRSRVLTFKDRKGKQYLAHIEVGSDTVEVVSRLPPRGTSVSITSTKLMLASGTATESSATALSCRMRLRLISTGIRRCSTVASTRRDVSSRRY